MKNKGTIFDLNGVNDIVFGSLALDKKKDIKQVEIKEEVYLK